MFVLLHPSTQCNVGQYLQNCPFSMIVDSSWRVETVLLWTELCLRSWFPLLHALQADHEGLPGCKGRSFICESSSNLMRLPANRLCCPWEIQRHGTPPSTHPSTKLVLIKNHLYEEYECALNAKILCYLSGLLMEKHPTARWLVEQVIHMNPK